MLGIDLKKVVRDRLARDYRRSGRSFRNINICFAGKTAGIVLQQRRVTLPEIVDDEDYSQKHCDLMAAFGLHELAHLWFTDTEPWDWAVETSGRFVGSLINGLEDARIEQKAVKAGYVNQAIFEGLVNHHLYMGYVEPSDRRDIPFLLAIEARRLNGFYISAKPVLDDCPWAAGIWQALRQVRLAKSTAEIVTIALKLHRCLRD